MGEFTSLHLHGETLAGVFIETLGFVIVRVGAQEAVLSPRFDRAGMHVEQACHFVEREQPARSQAVIA